MPGKQVRNWRLYHRLRRRGLAKTTAARIANSRRRSRR